MADLNEYYKQVEQLGSLRTPMHARRWSRATLNMLGVYMGRKGKKELASALPEELSHDLKRVFWVAHFRNTEMSNYEFQERVARRSGNTDPDFAYYPIKAVFHGLKQIVNNQVEDAVADALSPEMRELWQSA